MGKARRSERVAVIAKELVDNPGKLFTLGEFTATFDAAKSTISEDIGIVKKIFHRLELGVIQTVTGAAGGVKYVPHKGERELWEIVEGLCRRLSDPLRALPGGFIYMSDIISSPHCMQQAGEVFATRFAVREAEYVLTMETKGIPVAMMTARALNIPLVVIRRQSRVTEGSVVSINYVSGSSERIQTMSLPRRALPEGAPVLFIDDFMRAGGTARGVTALLEEFDADLRGIGVLVETAEPQKKLVSDYLSLAVLQEVDHGASRVRVEPAAWVRH